MIVSHKHKFIFIKPRKVAGSSVEAALAKQCGPTDIITPILLDRSVDEEAVSDYSRNYEGYFNHIKPVRIREKVGQEIWNSYFKFSIVRNPWDMLVSRYFWNKKVAHLRKTPVQILPALAKHPFNKDTWGKFAIALDRTIRRKTVAPTDDFPTFIKKLHGNFSNTSYYFDSEGRPINDFVLRFEQLDQDYKTVCEKIGILYEPLPNLKTKTRSKRSYTEMYTTELREHVAQLFKKEIEYFGYSFEI